MLEQDFYCGPLQMCTWMSSCPEENQMQWIDRYMYMDHLKIVMCYDYIEIGQFKKKIPVFLLTLPTLIFNAYPEVFIAYPEVFNAYPEVCIAILDKHC